MKNLLAITCLTMALAACNKEKEVKQFYGTGEISRTHIEVNGKKNGPMTEYYKDGKVKAVRLFENDVQIGKTTYYYPGGAIKEAQYYEAGKLHGGDTVFFENGNPQFMRNFNQGKLDGYIRKWAADGSVIFEARYANDTLVEVKGEPVHPDSLRYKEPISKKEN
jgi:antitoxin component YwqK of YwqJK toxin-antitoxin module